MLSPGRVFWAAQGWNEKSACSAARELDERSRQQSICQFCLETEYLGNEGSGQTASLQILAWPDPSKRSMEEKALRLIFFLPRFSILFQSRYCRTTQQEMFIKIQKCKSPIITWSKLSYRLGLKGASRRGLLDINSCCSINGKSALSTCNALARLLLSEVLQVHTASHSKNVMYSKWN